MTIKVGDRIPSATLQKMGKDGPEAVSTDDFFADRVVVLFGVPGAFTPTCSNQHLPGFVERAEEIKAKGVDEIACLAVNDAFVMTAWGKSQNVGDKVTMLADGSGVFTEAAGLELDLTGLGLGRRCQRFLMVVTDGIVKEVTVEEKPPEAKQTGAEALLERWADAYLHRGSADSGL